MRLHLAVALAALALAVPFAHADTTFTIQFDDEGLVFTGDGPLVGPIVGTGTFVSPINLTPGTYDLTALTGFTLDLSFISGDVFTQADITTPLTGVAITIVPDGEGERLFFTESGGTGSDDGPEFGALDLDNGSRFLTFEPSYSGGNFLYQESSGYDGRYLAADAPEPSSFVLLGTGIITAFGAARRRLFS